MKNKNIVCLGGGIGTSNLIRGLKRVTDNITAIISVADNGGSGGRIRRLYQMHPPGDIISCLAALADDPHVSELLTYRLPGDRYAEDHVLPGHKLGNIILAATTQMTDSFDEGVTYVKDIFHIKGNVYAATKDFMTLSARTIEGTIVEGEEAIDLGKYEGARVLDEIFIHPKNPTVDDKVIEAIKNAEVIIAGPGDLYTAILPLLVVPAITSAILESSAEKIFVVNIANKPFETKGYVVEDFIKAVVKHMGSFPFTKLIINNSFSHVIPAKYHYTYVKLDNQQTIPDTVQILSHDLVDEQFPIYHDTNKLAKVIEETI